MSYQEEITTLIESVEKPRRKPKQRYIKPDAIKELEKLWFEFQYKDSALPEYIRTKDKFSDNNANSLTKCVICYIKLKGGQAYRINSQGQFDFKLNKYRFSGMRKGLPDIQAIVNGQFIGIEVKIGADRQSKHQQKIQSEIEASGGVTSCQEISWILKIGLMTF